jgi:hypothetical protein
MWCKQRAEEFISVNGLKVDDEDRLKMAKAVSIGAQRAAMALKRRARGDFSPDSPAPLATHAADMSAVDKPGKPVTLESLLEGWAAVRAAGGNGVLPLPVLQVMVRVARQCLHTLEAGKREGDKGC